MIEYGDDKIKCKVCKADGLLTMDNRLIINIKKETFDHLYKCIQSFSLEIIEYTSQKCDLFISNFPKIKKVDSGTLSILKSKFKYDGCNIHLFEFSKIRQFQAEGNKIILFITDDKQVQITFKYESPLKWVALYENMLARS